jgi:ketosteroid isomerase-like protein
MESTGELVRGLYNSFARGDVPAFLAQLDPAIEWKEADGFPYAGTYRGPDAIVQGVLGRLGSEWDGFTVKADAIVAEGDTAVAHGTYSGTFKQSGKSMNARFAHVWKLRDSKVAAFEQIVDSVPVVAATR